MTKPVTSNPSQVHQETTPEKPKQSLLSKLGRVFSNDPAPPSTSLESSRISAPSRPQFTEAEKRTIQEIREQLNKIIFDFTSSDESRSKAMARLVKSADPSLLIAAINFPSRNIFTGGTPLTYAIKWGNEDILKMLAANGAEFTPECFSDPISNANVPMVDLLLKLGAEPSDDNLCHAICKLRYYFPNEGHSLNKVEAQELDPSRLQIFQALMAARRRAPISGVLFQLASQRQLTHLLANPTSVEASPAVQFHKGPLGAREIDLDHSGNENRNKAQKLSTIQPEVRADDQELYPL